MTPEEFEEYRDRARAACSREKLFEDPTPELAEELEARVAEHEALHGRLLWVSTRNKFKDGREIVFITYENAYFMHFKNPENPEMEQILCLSREAMGAVIANYDVFGDHERDMEAFYANLDPRLVEEVE